MDDLTSLFTSVLDSDDSTLHVRLFLCAGDYERERDREKDRLK